MHVFHITSQKMNQSLSLRQNLTPKSVPALTGLTLKALNFFMKIVETKGFF